jgi:glutamate dehydrogenase
VSDEAAGEPVPDSDTSRPPVHDRVLEEIDARAPDRAGLRRELARVALRRVPIDQLDRAEPAVVATHLIELFELMDERRPGETSVVTRRPEQGLDGRLPGTVVQIASEDRPFLLSTTLEELANHDLNVVYELHPIVGVERGEDGRLTSVGPARTAHDRESLLHLELDRHLPDDEAEHLVARLHELVHDVMAVTGDHTAMCERLRALADDLREQAAAGRDDSATRDPEADPAEVAALIDWVLDDNLVLLGLREYDLDEHAGARTIEARQGSGLGLLGDDTTSGYVRPVSVGQLPDEVRERLDSPRLLVVSRTRRAATVQRHVPM